MNTKKNYCKPEIKTWGTVMDLTEVGFTHGGSDIKGGSVTWSNAGGKKNQQKEEKQNMNQHGKKLGWYK